MIFSALASLCILTSAVLPNAALAGLVESRVSKEPLRSSLVGILAVSARGDTLISYNSNQRMIPASNVKILTAGMSLNTLGPDYRFETSLAYDGEVKDSTLTGNLYIVGGADPTLGASYRSVQPIENVFSGWKGLLLKNGIARIEGSVVADPRFLDGNPILPSWCVEDVGASYGAGPTGLNFYENAQDFTVTPSDSVGKAVSVFPSYPVTPWMDVEYDCLASPAGCGDELYYDVSPLSPTARMWGRYAIDRPEKEIHCANPFGAYTCAHYFCEFLSNNGIPVSGGFADVTSSGEIRHDLLLPADGTVPSDSLVFIGSTFSPKLSVILADMMRESDNFYAETLFRMMGKQKTGCASYDSACVAASCAMNRLRMSGRLEGLHQVDGSGLSRKNGVSPSFFVSFLKMMSYSPYYTEFLQSFPRPGTGTLVSRLRNLPEEARSRVRMKSGSMDGVRCFSGYILSPDSMPENTVCFSFMLNNLTARPSEINPVIDAILSAIVQEVK